MRELLEPIVGESGALVAQLLITTAVVLALIGIVYWLVRRFGAMRIGGIGRGRVPRLAIVDALALDNRRRLILIRRDATEHLILIGGPSDVLVESAIARMRQRANQPATAGAAAPTAGDPARPMATHPASPVPQARPPAPQPRAARFTEEERGAVPIPFPTQRVNQPRGLETISPSFHPFQRVAATPPSDAGLAVRPDHAPTETFGPERGQFRSPPVEVSATSSIDPEPPSIYGPPVDEFEPEAMTDRLVHATAPVPTNGRGDHAGETPDERDEEATALAMTADGMVPNGADGREGGGLEAEMARLLGEITAQRSSS